MGNTFPGSLSLILCFPHLGNSPCSPRFSFSFVSFSDEKIWQEAAQPEADSCQEQDQARQKTSLLHSASEVPSCPLQYAGFGSSFLWCERED